MAGDRGQAEAGGDLAEEQIDDEQPPGRWPPSSRGSGRGGALLQPVAFEQADHRQHDPDDRDEAIVVERLAEAAAITSSRPLPAISPVASAATVTTSIGLSRSAKPMTTIRMPARTKYWGASSKSSPGRGGGPRAQCWWRGRRREHAKAPLHHASHGPPPRSGGGTSRLSIAPSSRRLDHEDVAGRHLGRGGGGEHLLAAVGADHLVHARPRVAAARNARAARRGGGWRGWRRASARGSGCGAPTPSPPRCAPLAARAAADREALEDAPGSGSPISRDRSGGCWSYGSAPRSPRRNPGRPRRRRRSSHNIGSGRLPKVKLFIVPWLGASAPAGGEQAVGDHLAGLDIAGDDRGRDNAG